jgi:hypothetical protein
MRKIIVLASLSIAFATTTAAQAQNGEWNEQTCKQAMLGFKDEDALRQNVKDLREKIAQGDKTEETFSILSYYRDVEWYCLER